MAYTDLGQMVKKKYPGAYDDLSDDELGRKASVKYPGAYYDIIGTEATLTQPVAPKKSGVEKVGDFLGISNFGKRIGSELVRFTPEGRQLKKLEKEGGVSKDEARSIRTGDVSNKQFAGSVINTAISLFAPGASKGLEGTVGAVKGATGVINKIIAGVKSLAPVAKQGAKTGAGLGTGQALQDEQDLSAVVKGATTGAVVGATTMPLFQAVGTAVGKTLKGTGKAIAGRFFKTDKNTSKYLDKSVPQILEEKGLFGKSPQEVYDLLDNEQQVIGRAIGEFDKKTRSSSATIDTRAIAKKLFDVASRYDTTTSREISDPLLALAAKFETGSMRLGQAVDEFRAYNKLIGGKFGQASPPATLEKNIAIRSGIMEELDKIADKLPEFRSLNKAYAETTAALNSADKAKLSQLNKSPVTAVDLVLGGGIGAAGTLNPATIIPTLTALAAKKVLDNPKAATTVAKGVSKTANIRPVNNKLSKLLIQLGLVKSVKPPADTE